MAEFATTPPIPYVPLADKATEVRTAVGLAPDTTGNTNLNAILAAGPAASRDAVEVLKYSPEAAQISTEVVDIWDDFNRADTAIGVVTNAPTGQTYDLRAGGAYTSPVRILNKRLVCEKDKTFYVGGNLLSEPVFNMGCLVDWTKASGTRFTQVVFLIKPNVSWLNELIHIRIGRFACYIETTPVEGGGSAALVQRAITTAAYSVNPFNRPSNGEICSYEVLIQGDKIILLCDGSEIISYEGSEVSAINGTWVYWENFQDGDADTMAIRRIWANDRRQNNGNIVGQRLMPYSGFLASLADGACNFHSGGTIKNGSLTLENGIVTSGGFRTLINSSLGGASFGYAPISTGYNINEVSNTAGTATAAGNMQPGAYIVGKNGDRMFFDYHGRYAANSNTKTINYRIAATQIFTSGGRAVNGGTWRLRVTMLKTATTNRVFFFELTDNLGVVTGYATSAIGLNSSIIHDLTLLADGAGDIVFTAAFAVAHLA